VSPRFGNVWHLARTPTGLHAHQLDPAALEAYVEQEMAGDPDLSRAIAEAEAIGAACETLRGELGFPKNMRWVDRDGWDSSVGEGDPHPTYLAGATVVRQGAEQ
jgi:hypothetical protein